MLIVDVTPLADTGLSTARRLSGLPAPPVAILTSSADPAQFGAELNNHRFIAKADITATVITDLANTREQAVPNPDTPAQHPSHADECPAPLATCEFAARHPQKSGEWDNEGITP